MATVTSIAQIPNPFRAVAEYPPTLPYVGQDSVYHRLQDFTRSIDAEEQAHFMALYGDWAIGKSRLAHELIAQFCGKSVGWTLTTGQPAAPLLHSLPDNGDILPLFVPFVNAIRFEGGDFTDGFYLIHDHQHAAHLPAGHLTQRRHDPRRAFGVGE